MVQTSRRVTRALHILSAIALSANMLLAPTLAIAQTAQPATPAVPPQSAPAQSAPAQPAPAAAAPAATDAAAPAAQPIPSTPDALPATLPHDLTPWGMFMAADWVVKAVMLGLAFASLVTWTIWLAKGLELVAARRSAHVALRHLAQAASLDEANDAIKARSGAVGKLVQAALLELHMSADLADKEGIKERIASRLSRLEHAAGRRMTRGTGVLATIGSTAPFVGLFGTVWGIMNSFIGISRSQTTNLAVVAPGIAEALLATAIGLVAAIPAVMIYNVFARGITAYRAQLGDGAAEILRLAGRDLDRADQAQPPMRRHLSSAAE